MNKKQTNPVPTKAVFKCREDFKEKFKNSHCLLTISVGQEVHEGEKFIQTIKLVNNAFKECTICIDDVIQRHSMSLVSDKTVEELFDKALEQGDLWLVKNKHCYDRLTIPYKIFRWNDLLIHPKYNERYLAIQKLYQTDVAYRNSINDTIKEFLQRYTRRLESTIKFSYDSAINTCKDYLFEECAALCILAYSHYNFEVYPNKRNMAMDATHKKLILPYNSDVLYHVGIKFKNRKQLQPQQFNQKI